MKACAQLRAAIADGVSLTVTVRIQEDMPRSEDITYFSAQTAEVEVDPETGEVNVERLVTATTSAPTINPASPGPGRRRHRYRLRAGHDRGAVEDEGRIVNPQLGEYKLPRIADMPALETVWSIRRRGPASDAKAIGELANNARPPPSPTPWRTP